MTRSTLPTTLSDQPTYLLDNWKGYSNFQDFTTVDPNSLIPPSQNCTIPSFDKIIPDRGKTLKGQLYTENVGMIGNKQKFKNLGGIEMEARVWASLDSDLGDVIEVGYDNNRLVFSTLVGSFQVGETISGQTSGAGGVVEAVVGTVLFLSEITGIFEIAENILGNTSGATAVTVLVPEYLFLPITQNPNPLPRGVHEYYFDEWFDTSLNPAQSQNLPRLIWVNGYRDSSTPVKGAVYSWTGGIAVITSFVANTSISINPATTWASLGFVNPMLPGAITYNITSGTFAVGETVTGGTSGATGIVTSDIASTLGVQSITGVFEIGETITGGTSGATAVVASYFPPSSSGSSGNIIINGTLYTITGGWETSTLTTASTTGISIGDTATSQIEVDIAPVPFDNCRQNKGYMFYGNEDMRDYYQSNAFNRSSNYTITNFQGGLLNDLVINANTYVYTGTIESVFHIIIDSAATQTQSFVGTGINDGFFDTSGYSGTGDNVYKVVMVADFTIVTATAGGTYTLGEVLIGSASSAEAVLIGRIVNGSNDELAVKMISFNSFTTADNIIGQQSGVTKNPSSILYQDWVQYYKNDVLTSATSGPVSGTLVPLFNSPPDTVTLSDGLDIVFGNFYGHTVGDYFQITTTSNNSDQVDTFQWQKDGGVLSDSIQIDAGNFQDLSDGVQIKFLNDVGHTVGDSWNITAVPGIARAWDNFYYALPVRKPGEGYKYRLPSNFWAHDTQEESIYVNGSYGEWSVVDTTLSADLQSETVSLQPLKQTGANKVLYPYLTGHVNDKLVYINTKKELNTIGREQFLEKPQTGYLSDPVKNDFLASSFIGGRIKYFDKKLYVTSPQDGVMHCLDTFKGYWQPIKRFPEMGLLTIIGNDLACHSNVRNQTFTLFTNTAGDNGTEYEVIIRTAYANLGSRWSSKASNNSFIEGYIEGNPPLTHTVYLEPGGCGGIFPHPVAPIVCVIPDRAPFGEGSFGSHSFGSDMFTPQTYFQEIYKAYAPQLNYYFISLGINCIAKTHSWSILSLGMNGIWSLNNNAPLVNRSNLAKNQN